MDFSSFLARLPRCPGPTTAPISDQSKEFFYPPEGAQDFVGPDLSERADATVSASPDILVISAPGAVGKSTLAKELAFRLGAPLWDLSEADAIGAYSVIGRLTKSFGTSGLPGVQTSMSAGQGFIVVDALDEGRLKSNEAGFEAFLKDLAQLSGKSGTCKAVLLGRTQVAETAWLTLDSVGAKTGILTIEPFTDTQAIDYVDRRVKRIGGPGATLAQTHQQKYAEARDAIFNELKATFSGVGSDSTNDVRSFMGYAPVLDAIATLLAKESNFAVLISDIKKNEGTTQNRAIALLTKIVERILAREQDEKVAKNIRPGIEQVAKNNNWGAWNLLYSHAEQCVRLLGQITKVKPTAPISLPGPVLSAYEQRLAPFIPEHPFLRDATHPANIVFESYLFARALANDIGGFRSAVEAKMLDAAYKPSRLVADFYQMLLGERTVGIPASHVNVIHRSLQAGESATNHLRVSIEGLDPEEAPDGISTGACEFEYIDQGGNSHWKWEFETTIPKGGELTFGRYLRDAEVTVPCQVRLGAGLREMEIGPAVYLRCGSLIIASESLVIGGTTKLHQSEEDEPAVVLEALSCQSTITGKPKVHGVDFRVSWPGAEHFPWTEFKFQGGIGPGAELHEAYRRFRRIVLTLRSHSKGQLARLDDKINHQRVLQGPLGVRLLERMTADGILVLDGRMYVWVPAKATEHVGTSWHDLKFGVASARLSAYLTAFLQSTSSLPA